jgi:hypothetical protein
MNTKFVTGSRLLGMAVASLFLLGSVRLALAGDLKLEAQLIWGTNDKTSPNPNHKTVEADVEKRLKNLPFKWSNYFEVSRQTVKVPATGEARGRMSEDCEVVIKQVGSGQVEVTLLGKGKQVGKITQALPKKELLLLGGNAPNFTAWFVALRQVD